MDPQLKVSRTVTWMSFKKPFFGSCLMQLGTKEKDLGGCYGATDGTHVYWDRDAMTRLQTELEVRYVMAHETMHVVLMHCEVFKHPEKWDLDVCNIAMDWSINWELDTNCYGDMIRPSDMIIDPTGQTNGWHWQEIYKFLMNIKNDNPKPFQGTPGEGKGREGNGPQISKPDMDKIKRQLENAQGHLLVPSHKPTDADMTKMQNRIKDVTIRAAEADKSSGIGSTPGSILQIIEDIREPKVNWEELLHNIVVCRYPQDYSYARMNRKHFGSDLILPFTIGAKAGTICLGMDTSGSIGQDEISAYTSEMAWIINELKPDRVILLSADCGDPVVVEFPAGHYFAPKDLEIKGGRGTSFRPVFKYIEDNAINPDQIIYFSDMLLGRSEIPEEEPAYPVTWVCSRNRGYVPPFGEFIRLEV